MKKLLSRSLLFLVALVIGFGAGLYCFPVIFEAFFYRTTDITHLNSASRISTSLIALKMLRSGNTDSAISILESEIDTAIITLSDFEPNNTYISNTIVAGANLAIEHRSEHPSQMPDSQFQKSLSESLSHLKNITAP